METWQSWAAFLLIASSLAYYYYPAERPHTKGRSNRQNTAYAGANAASTASRRRQQKHAGSSAPRAVSSDGDSSASYASGADSSRPNGTARAAVAQSQKATRHDRTAQSNGSALRAAAVAGADAKDDEHNDNEWAQQLAATQRGVTLKSQDRAAAAAKRGTKTTKVKLNGNTDSPSFQSTAASTDAYADDDLSPLPTPQMAAVAAPEHTSRDVSDMLEPAAAGPSVLRLTGDASQRKSQVPRSVSPAKETKKQRQNRKKAEEQKALRDEDEKQRRVLMEQQRRGAREARGEPARNGLGVAKASASSAWTNGSASSTNPSSAATSATDMPLLDTFEPDTRPAAPTSAPQTNGNHSVPLLQQDLPTEDEQMRMISEMNGWNEVSSKKQKKKKDVPSGSDNEMAAAPKPKPTAPAAEKPGSNAPSKSNGYSALNVETGGHVLDSDWAV